MNRSMEPDQSTISNEREKQREVLSDFLKDSKKERSPYYTLKASRKRAVLRGRLFKKAYQKESIVAWRNSFVPTEIFYALDIIPFAAEGNCSMFANSGLSTKPLNLAEENLYSRDTCSFLRCLAGTSILNCMPTPDFLVATSHYCDGAPKVFYNLSKKYNKPFFLIDVPYNYSEEKTSYYDSPIGYYDSYKKEALDYVAAQLEDILVSIARKIGKKIDFGKLDKSINFSNQAREYFIKVNELRKSVPSPFRGSEAIDYVAMIDYTWGLEDTIEIYKLLYEEVKTRMENKALPQEKYRILWRHMKPYYTTELMAYLENKCGAVVAFEEVNYIYWDKIDPRDPFRGLARKLLANSAISSITPWMKYTLNFIEEYKIDGVIEFAHWGCRHLINGTNILREELRKRHIPLLVLDGDCLDRKNYSHSQVKTRIDAFIEALAVRK